MPQLSLEIISGSLAGILLQRGILEIYGLLILKRNYGHNTLVQSHLVLDSAWFRGGDVSILEVDGMVKHISATFIDIPFHIKLGLRFLLDQTKVFTKCSTVWLNTKMLFIFMEVLILNQTNLATNSLKFSLWHPNKISFYAT